MKKFVFRLEFLLRVKLSLEKEQKAKLQEIQALLRSLEAELAAMRERQREQGIRFREESAKGISGERMAVYGHYFDHLRDAINEQIRRINEAREEKGRRQAALLRTMKEIKTLRKLRTAQYEEYLAEVAREEEKAIGDIVSFNATVGG